MTSDTEPTLLDLAVRLTRSDEFPRAAAEAVRQVHARIRPGAEVSVHCLEPDGERARHYYLHPPPSGSELVERAATPVFQALDEGRTVRWRQDGAASLAVRGARCVVSVTAARARDFDDGDAGRLAAMAPALELLCLRHQDLRRVESLTARVAQADESLAALYDGSYDLSGMNQQEVAHKVIDLVRDQLGLDRAGLFLRDGDLLRGAFGVDDRGQVVSISETTFALYPPPGVTVAEAALIQRGELDYFLTQDLDGEGHESVEGDIGANVSVPMQVGHRIIGVLAADTYVTRRPIDPSLLRPLMILANQAAAALENARLYDELREASMDLERRVELRTAELTRANEDKELLLKEVYHRTKNNLQLVVSMLRLQRGRLHDATAAKALEDCANRVLAMSSIHEQLYSSADLKAIDFGRHLHGLVSHLMKSYQVAPGTITLRMEAEYLLLSLDTAVPLSLIVNELVTNCLKYAFPDGRAGTLEIGLHLEGDDVHLDIGDDGIGMPAGFELDSVVTMGLQIATALTAQLRATLVHDASRATGTAFRIVLPDLVRTMRAGDAA